VRAPTYASYLHPVSGTPALAAAFSTANGPHRAKRIRLLKANRQIAA
jgi:hypothetical protein